MVPSHTTKNSTKRYRYYVCANAQARGWHNCPTPSVPAPEIEQFVVQQIKSVGKDSEVVAQIVEQSRHQREQVIGDLQAEKRALERDLQQQYHEAVQFYKHEVDWTNRLILGDSKQVMASLAHREGLAGRV